MTFDDLKDEIVEPIGCLDCHDPKTMKLRLSRPALIDALQRQGRDLDSITNQEMRSLVCAQCHVTYYFEPETKEITFPWDKGIKADQILAYYDEEGFSEWVHPDAGTGLVKPRHAEYETFMNSTHQSAGVACADCHMPYTRIGNKKISSHTWQSPLNNIEESCTTCHRDVYKRQVQGSRCLVDAIQGITNARLANPARLSFTEIESGHPLVRWRCV